MKFCWIILPFLLSGCEVSSFSNEISLKKQELNHVKLSILFSLEGELYAYLAKDGCISCAAIEEQIQTIALQMDEFYFVDIDVDILLGYRKEDNIGVDNYLDLRLTGYPTLLFLKDQQVKNIYVGINEISRILF